MFSSMGLISSIIIGALVGWAAGKIMKSSRGLLGNIILGWVGSILGGFIANWLNISSGSLAGNILLSVVGACLILLVFGRSNR